MLGLLIPHFSLGLGIGTLDAALIPYMATLVDLKYGDDESTASEVFSLFLNLFFLKIKSHRRHDIQLRIGVCHPANIRQFSLFIGTDFRWRNGAISRILLVDGNHWHIERRLRINVAIFTDRLEKQCKK